MKDAVAKILLIITLFFTFVGCSSCASSSYFFGPGNLFRDKRRSFIKIDIYKNILLTRTSTEGIEAQEEEYELNMRSSASGFLVGHDRDVSLIATSAHVCTVLSGKQLNRFIPDFDPSSRVWNVKEKNAFIMNDYKGRAYAGIPIAYDIRADICILASSLISIPALRISKSDPIIGEKYYNIAAPMGLWSKQMIPLFEGYYLGKMKTYKGQKKSYAFSIPTKGGSSGSPIINSQGEVVGAIHSAYRGFENLCMATTNHQIYMLYRSSMSKLLKDYDMYKTIIDLINT
jgi:S1-C subfamily serine protease|tara:strand:- start:5289 stop:6149 length:861 start_codon:yes stop_codon:yes gene_type:complete